MPGKKIDARNRCQAKFFFDRKATILGESLYDNLKEKLQAAIVAHADETHWRQDGINHQVWYVGNDDLAFFHIDRHRSAEVAESILRYFNGVLHTDGYAAYNVLNPRPRQACIAHLIRNAKEIKQTILIKQKKNQDENSIAFCDNITIFLKKRVKLRISFYTIKN